MNLNYLLEILKTAPPQSALVFTVDEGDIGQGYHVTEFKLSRTTGIDCGARVTEWSEAAVQLLDGSGGQHMAVQKFQNILEQSIARVDGLGVAEAHIEFSPKNKGLRTYLLNTPKIAGGNVFIRLSESRAVCKPAQEAGLDCIDPVVVTDSDAVQSGCCGPTVGGDSRPASSKCCG